MTPQSTRVLRDLKRRLSRGISVLDYPTGFRLSARIRDLRASGHVIHSQRDGDKPTWRYFYIRGPE